MKAKKAIASKTLWANAFSIAATVATVYGHGPIAALISDPATQAAIIALVTAAANLVLRVVTKEPIRL